MKHFIRLIILMLAVCSLLSTLLVHAEEMDKLPKYQNSEKFSQPVYSVTGEEKNLVGSHTLLIYSLDGCGACMGLLERMDPIVEILGDEYVNIRFGWLDSIPVEISEVSSITEEHHYSLSSESFWPSYYILDEDGTVVSSHSTIEEAMDSLFAMDLYPIDYLQNSCIEYFRKSIINDPQAPQIIYFSMTGCPDCSEADDMLVENDNLFQQFEINRIYRKNETDPAKRRDEFALFKYAFNVSWYPSFIVIINDEISFIGQESIDDLPQMFFDMIR